jgi:acetyltransferase-like isoleucine patch superfamily enzyme
MQVNLDTGESGDPRIIIGDDAEIGAASQISASAGIIIERGARLGEEVLLIDNTHTYENPRLPVPEQAIVVGGPIRVGAGAYVGRGAVVLMGVTIGEGAIVLDRAVVRSDVAPRSCVAGNPACPISRYDPERKKWMPLAGEGKE